MTGLFEWLKGFHKEESGQGLVEYLLIIALLALATIAGVKDAANYVTNGFDKIGSTLNSAIGT